MSLTCGKECIRCRKYHYSVNGAIPITDKNGCDRMICLDCLIDMVKVSVHIEEMNKARVSEIDKEIDKLKAEKKRLSK